MAGHDATTLIGLFTDSRSAGRLDEAAAALAALTAAYPAHSRLPLLDAQLLEARGKHATALPIYQAALQQNPTDPLRRRRVFRCLQALGAHKEALELLDAGLGITPLDADFLLQRGILLRLAGRLEEAAAAFTALAAAHPAHPRLPLLNAELFEARGEHAASRPIHEAALRAQPNDTLCRMRLVMCLRRLHAFAEALDVLREGVALAPGEPNLLAEWIIALCHSGRLDEAQAAFAALALADPTHPRLALLRVDLAKSSGDEVTALSLLEAEFRAKPADARLRLRMVTFLKRLGAATKAMAILQSAENIAPVERQIYAECLMDLGRFDESQALLGSWPVRTPEDRLTMLRAGMRLAALRLDHPASMRCAEAALAIQPADTAAIDRLALSAALSFQPALAIAAQKQRPGQRRASLRGGLTGQLVNEMRMRPAETTQLAAASGLPAEAHFSIATDHMRRDGSSTPAALAVLHALARLGRPDGPVSASTDPSAMRIPRLIHQFWDEASPTEEVARMMDGTRALHPDFAYTRWNHATAQEFLAGHTAPQVRRAYRIARHVAVRADLLRLALLLVEGGVYLDVDNLCRAPLTTLLPGGAELVLYQDDPGSIGNDFMAAAPGHPLVAEALAGAAAAVADGAGETVWLSTGPGLISRILARAVAAGALPNIPAGVQLWSLPTVCAVIARHRPLNYKRDGRHWSRGE